MINVVESSVGPESLPKVRRAASGLHTPSPEGTGGVGLESYETVFCDSLEALDAAYAHGLSRGARILTRAPALLARDDLPAIDLGGRRHASDADLESFYFSGANFLEDCLRLLEHDCATAPFARLICRELWRWQQTAMYATFLDDTDWTESRLVIEADLGNEAASRRVRHPWGALLGDNPLCKTFRARTKRADDRDVQVEPLTVRFRIRGIEHIGWRLAEKASAYVPAKFSRGTLYFIVENELVRDCAVAFASRGYRVVRLKIGREPSSTSGCHSVTTLAAKLLATPMRKRMDGIVPAASLPALLKVFTMRLSHQLDAYDGTKSWLGSNDLALERGRAAIVTNFPDGGAMLALAEHAKDNRVVFAAAQHGITREILDRPQNQVMYENIVAPYFLSMTEAGAQVTLANTLGLASTRAAAVGLPRDYVRTGRASARAAAPPIVYAQMISSAGPLFNGLLYRDDFANYRREKDFLADVLARVGHRVLFKSYPTFRYADPDQILDFARSIPNIELDTTGVDLRFLLSQHRVVVTSCASSTLSWCINSGRPVVYIDPTTYGLRLTPEVREIFQSVCFYFDERAADFHVRIRSFLDRPIAKIESEWATNASGRAKRLRRYFGSSDVPRQSAFHWLRTEMERLASADEANREAEKPAPW